MDGREMSSMPYFVFAQIIFVLAGTVMLAMSLPLLWKIVAVLPAAIAVVLSGFGIGVGFGYQEPVFWLGLIALASTYVVIGVHDHLESRRTG